MPEYYPSRLRTVSGFRYDTRMNEMTDAELQLAVTDLISGNPTIDSTGIVVKAELGFINLDGYVQDKEQRALVEKVVREFRGVKDVFNYLTLKPKGIMGDTNIPHGTQTAGCANAANRQTNAVR